ncbi:MAG: hypothetical protein ACOY4Q_14585 [Bacillota bacterium]
MKLRLKRERASDFTNFTADQKHKINGRKATSYLNEKQVGRRCVGERW